VLIAQGIVLSKSATLQSLSIFTPTPAGSLRVGLYDAAGPGGTPRNIKTQVSLTPAIGWNTVAVTPLLMAAGNYWLVFLPTDNNLGVPKATTSGLCTWIANVTGPMPATFPAVPGTGSCHWSIYATLSVP